MKKLAATFVFILSFAYHSLAQQDAQYSQYMFNSLVINPAYAGYREKVNISLLHRDQWVSFPGAPKTQSVVADGAFFNNKVGLGLAVINDKAGLQGQLSVYGNYAYRLPVGETATLAFGLGLGVAQFTLDGERATTEDPNDPFFTAGKQTFYAPDARFGMHLSNEKYYVGLSATNVLSGVIDYENVTKNVVATQSRHYFLTAGYLIDVNESLKLKPSFLIKEDTKGPTSIDLNTFLLVKEKVWIGGSYRSNVNLWKKTNLINGLSTSNSVVGIVEFYLGGSFRAGYAYDYAVSGLKGYSNGTHELSIGVVLGAGQRRTGILTPRYF